MLLSFLHQAGQILGEQGLRTELIGSEPWSARSMLVLFFAQRCGFLSALTLQTGASRLPLLLIAV